MPRYTIKYKRYIVTVYFLGVGTFPEDLLFWQSFTLTPFENTVVKSVRCPLLYDNCLILPVGIRETICLVDFITLQQGYNDS